MSSTNSLENRKYEKKDYLTDVPYAELYEMRGNRFEHKIKLEQMATEAAAVGYRTFKATYEEYKKSRPDASSYISTGNTTEFEGQPMELDCGAWHADDLGITMGTQFGEIVACVHPIEPIRRLVNVDTGVEKIELAFRKGHMWRKIIADRQTLASANKIVALSDNGIAVTSENAKHLVRFLHDTENYNYDAIPEIPSVGRLGHISGHGFSPYVDGLTFDGDASFKSMFTAVRTWGSYDVWREEMRRIRSYSVGVKIVVAASFASALVGPLGALPFFVHLWGTTSGTGKTVALMAAASVWADPALGRYIKTFDSTSVGLEWYAGFLNSLPMIIDELQLSREANNKNKFSVYKLAEGVGRLRGRKTGGIDATVTWANCTITSGETPLTQDNSGAGALNRVIDIECNDIEHKLVSDGRQTSNILKSNYGFAGRTFIEKLDDDVINMVRDEYSRVAKTLAASDATDKQALSAALIIVADRLASEWIFNDIPISPDDMITFLQTNASVDINERAYAYLCDWVSANANKFSSISQQEIYGKIESGWAYIIRGVFNRAVENEGYSPRGLLGWLKKKGYIDTRGRAFTKPQRIGNVVTECVVLMLPVDSSELPF